jgi:hypothetical protein
MKLEHIRAEIERMRHQISRQRKDIQSLQRAGISTLPAEALLERMQATVDNLCAERDKHVGEQRMKFRAPVKLSKARRCDCDRARGPRWSGSRQVDWRVSALISVSNLHGV